MYFGVHMCVCVQVVYLTQVKTHSQKSVGVFKQKQKRILAKRTWELFDVTVIYIAQVWRVWIDVVKVKQLRLMTMMMM